MDIVTVYEDDSGDDVLKYKGNYYSFFSGTGAPLREKARTIVDYPEYFVHTARNKLDLPLSPMLQKIVVN